MDEISLDLNELSLQAARSSKDKTKKPVIFFFYYCGHGRDIEGKTYAITVPDMKEYNLLDMLYDRVIKFPNTVIAAFFDCCKVLNNTYIPKFDQEIY